MSTLSRRPPSAVDLNALKVTEGENLLHHPGINCADVDCCRLGNFRDLAWPFRYRYLTARIAPSTRIPARQDRDSRRLRWRRVYGLSPVAQGSRSRARC